VLGWGAFFTFAAAVLVLRYWLLPDVEHYRDAILARVAQTVGRQVEVGAIDAGWHGLRPQISFSNVRIHDAAGREALILPSVENVISWRSLLVLELRLHSLVIDGPRLAVRRDAGGALHVAGMKLSGGERDPRFGDWLLGQREIEIRNAEIEWQDEKRAAPPLTLAALNLRLRNSGDEHAVGLTARPPAALGSSIELRARLSGASVADIAAWSGRMYAEVGYTDLAAWRAWLDYPVDVRQGHGALRLWTTLEAGELRAATADVALVEVAARLGEDLPPLELASVQGRLQGRARSPGYELSARNLALTPVHGAGLQPTDFQLSWRPGRPDAVEHGALSARLVELAPLAQLAESLPFPGELRRQLAELQPRGELLDAKVEWQGPVAEPQQIGVRARFTGLGVQPWRSVPGFAGLSGTLATTQERGRLLLVARGVELDLPGLFPEPRVVLDTLNGQIDWQREGENGYALRLTSLSFANAHLAGSAAGTYANGGSGPGTVDLSAGLSRVDASRIVKYLPHGGLMGQKTRDWLAAAILAGEASEVQLRLRGSLADFPFRDPAGGQFLVTGRFEKGVLNYAAAWPRAYDIEGELRFEGDRMEILGRSGHVLGVKLANVRAVIPGLGGPSPVLAIAGQAEGPTGDFLRYVVSSPVRGMTDGMTEPFAASGRGRLGVKLEIPLEEPHTTRVAGEFNLAANTLSLSRQLPPIERASGRLSFTESGFTVHDLRGRFLGGGISVDGGTQPGGIEVRAKGEAAVAALGAFYEHPWRRFLTGTTTYSAILSVKDGVTRLGFESSLRGVASTLPAPLDKTPGEALPLRVDLLPADGGARDRVSLSVGRIAAGELLRRRQGDAMQVQRAVVWLSPVADQAIRLPERPGSLVYGSLPGLDLDRWLALLPARAPTKPGRKLDATAAETTTLDLRLGNLDAYGKRLRNVTLKATAGADSWSAAVDAHELAGDLFYRGEAGGQLTARLAHFTMPDDSPGARLPQASQPKDLPGIDLVTERFVLRGKQLGRVEAAAQRAGLDWRIDKLVIVNADGAASAQGSWKGGALSRSALDFQLDASDAGKFLARLGYPDLVKGGKAQFQGTVAWDGEPTTLHLASLDGNLKLHATDGQFLEIEPGSGRLVSLMSLQALPKRITLDFRDVFSKGFGFDEIAATARVQRGVMSLGEFQMRGSAADVRMSGEVDLGRETQDLKVRVVPSLGDSASAAVAIVNPIAGVAAAIAQRVLKDPLGRIFAYEYGVTGTWADPKVAKLATAVPLTPEPTP
jgi:uncharacterized protein (TIGR02099 family)